MGHVGGGNTWRGYPVEGFYDTHWLTGLWSTQAKVEGIVLKAAWHWGSDSGVINNPFGEPGHTSIVCRPLWTVTVCFSPDFMGELLNSGL